ncbi:MAG: hypothetical protein ACLRVU_03335 [Beduini sp.]|uniref:hypothetical protein n=1 Tax=Beduini sp. TaxID=1922300 RepID=UPI0039A1CEFB
MANSRIISELKQRVLNDLIHDHDVITLIDSPDQEKSNWEPIYLLNTPKTKEMGFTPHLYTEQQNPNFTNLPITFIIVEISIPNTENITFTWVKPILSITIISHRDHLFLDNDPKWKINRNDALSILIDEKFNSDGSYNDLHLVSNEPALYEKDFLSRTLIFEGIDLNNAL